MLQSSPRSPDRAVVSAPVQQEQSAEVAARPCLRENAAWTLAGNVVYTGCQWGILVVLARLGSPEMVGQFVLGLAVSAPVLMFTNLQLRGVLATDARHEYAFADYLGARLLMTALALLVIGCVVAGSQYSFAIAAVVLSVGL